MRTETHASNDHAEAVAERAVRVRRRVYGAAHEALREHHAVMTRDTREDLARRISRRLERMLVSHLYRSDGEISQIHRAAMVDLVRNYQWRHGHETAVAREVVDRLEWQLGATFPPSSIRTRYLPGKYGLWDRELNRKLCPCGAWSACDGRPPLLGLPCGYCGQRL